MDKDLINKISSNLSKRDRLLLEAKLIGYGSLPPTIEQFLEDPYYLGKIYGNGKLYEHWKNVLMKIFPDEIHCAYNGIVFTGAIGAGKSTVSRIIALYTKCRLYHLDNYDFFDLAAGKDFVFSFFHTTGEQINNTFIEPMEDFEDNVSPYFMNKSNRTKSFSMNCDTPRGKGPIGSDVIYYVFSEVNFIDPAKARSKINNAYSRMTSRFEKVLPYFGTIILDSSAAGKLINLLPSKLETI